MPCERLGSHGIFCIRRQPLDSISWRARLGWPLATHRAGTLELDPAKSGLYLRDHSFVSFWLDQRGLSGRELLSLAASETGVGSIDR